MRHRLLWSAVVFVWMLPTTLVQCQQLTIQTEGGKQVVLARSEIEALPHIKVTTGASDTPAAFEGVALEAVLEKAGVGFGDTLKGKRLASCLRCPNSTLRLRISRFFWPS